MESTILNQFKVIHANYEKKLNSYLKVHGIDISVRDAEILSKITDLKKTNKNTTTNIAKSFQMTPSAISITTKSLEQKGYIYRYHNITDRRIVYINLTSKINEFISGYLEVKRRVFEHMFAGIQEKNKEIFMNVLLTLSANTL